MAGYEIRWYGKSVEREIHTELIRRMDQCAQETTQHVKHKLSAGRRGHVGTHADSYAAGAPPHVDNGQLRQSIFWERRGDLVRIIGTPSKYALTQELGKTIRPKNGKYLAIPLSPQARTFRRRGGRALDFMPNGKRLRKIVRSAATIFLVETIGGRNRRSIIHYVITTEVTIKPHPFLRPSLDEMRPRYQQIFGGPA
jgi:hypothetical protein